jgi:hypothetical protein
VFLQVALRLFKTFHLGCDQEFRFFVAEFLPLCALSGLMRAA